MTETIQTQQFEHQLFINQSARLGFGGKELHVYLDGDGTPWTNHYRIATDPTSRNPLILELLAQDKAPSILLGRPCYHQHESAPECLSKYWTSHRYSTVIVDSLAQGLNAWLMMHDYQKVVLIGFSGGGTLAVLMAPSVPKVSTIVTIAANLDVEAWSRYHGYQPLTQSLNPAELTFDKRLQQIHLVGSHDKVVPLETITKYLKKNANAVLIEYPNFEHLCCWADNWQQVLTAALGGLTK